MVKEEMILTTLTVSCTKVCVRAELGEWVKLHRGDLIVEHEDDDEVKDQVKEESI